MKHPIPLCDHAEFRANDAICSMNGSAGRPDASALIRAIRSGDCPLVKAQLAGGVDINADDGVGITPLIYALGQRYALINSELERKGGSHDLYDSSFDMDGIELLLDAGADVALPNCHGATPLMCAAVSGQYRVAKMLLRKGADVTASTSQGHTALHYAGCWRGYHQRIITLLLDAGAEVNAQTHNGVSALLQAVAGRIPKAARLLLGAGADPNLPDCNGYTPLHYAVEIAVDTWSLEMVEILLAGGADPKRESPQLPFLQNPKVQQTPKLVDLLQMGR